MFNLKSYYKMAESAAMKLRKQLLNKEALLEGTENPVYKTNCMYRPFSDSQRYEVDLRVVGVQAMINAYKTLMNHEQACKELGIEDAKHIGYTVDDWKEDMKLRIAVINRTDNLKKIKALKAKIGTVLTAKELREIGIEDLTKELKDIE